MSYIIPVRNEGLYGEKLFVVRRYVIPEWGQTEHLSTQYFVTKTIDNVVAKILEDNHRFYKESRSDGSVVIKHYYSIDRMEEQFVITEEKCGWLCEC